MREYQFFAPKSFDELFETVKANAGAEVKYLAGGTDLVPHINLERDEIPYENKPPMVVVSLAGLGLASITEKDGAVVIGACATLTEVYESPLVGQKIPALIEAIREMAGFSVRNAATLGGNIMNASPAADSIPVLMVLDADLTLRGPGGERTVKAGAFFTGPGKTVASPDEVLCSITVVPGAGRAAFKKLGRRAAETLSVVNAAAYLEVEGGVCKAARLAVGSAAPTVVSCQDAAAALVGQPLDEAVVEKAAALVPAALSPINDIRASAWYRLQVAPAMAGRAIKAAAGLA